MGRIAEELPIGPLPYLTVGLTAPQHQMGAVGSNTPTSRGVSVVDQKSRRSPGTTHSAAQLRHVPARASRDRTEASEARSLAMSRDRSPKSHRKVESLCHPTCSNLLFVYLHTKTCIAHYELARADYL